jgi:hypothetical protein
MGTGKIEGHKRGRYVSSPAPYGYRFAGGGGSSPTRSRTPWGRQGVENMLENPVHAGELRGVKRAQPAIVGRQLGNAVRQVLETRAEAIRLGA